MAATPTTRRVAAIALLLVASFLATPHAGASTWTVAATQLAPGLAQSLTPQPPSTVTADCTSPLTDRTITVTWTDVSHATSYTVYQSTTSATAGFSVAATDITTTTWTSPTLKTKTTYWYAVATVSGSSTWISPMSDATAGHTIGAIPRCL